jgi:hypothetical protein
MFPTAHIARQYEAKIAAMPGIIETLQLRKKLALLETAYDHAEGEKELFDTKQRIEETLRVTFSGSTVTSLDPLFFPEGTPNLPKAFVPAIKSCFQDASSAASARFFSAVTTKRRCICRSKNMSATK